jgi:hypothetical protein
VIPALVLHGQAQAAQFVWNALLLLLGIIGVFLALRATRRSRPAQIIALVVAGIMVQAVVFWRLGVLERLRERFPLMTPQSWRGEMYQGGAVGLLVELPSIFVLPSGIVAWLWLWSLLLIAWRVAGGIDGVQMGPQSEGHAGQQRDEADEARDG